MTRTNNKLSQRIGNAFGNIGLYAVLIALVICLCVGAIGCAQNLIEGFISFSKGIV